MSESLESLARTDDKEILDQNIVALQRSVARLMNAQMEENSASIFFQMEITLRHLSGILAGIFDCESSVAPEVIRKLQRDLKRVQFAKTSARHALKRMYLIRYPKQKREIEHACSVDEWVQHLLQQIAERHRSGEPLVSICNEFLQLYSELSEHPPRLSQGHKTQIDIEKSISDIPQSMQFSVGTTVGHNYNIRRLVAEGGMAEIYEATEKNLDRPVALKVVTSGDTLSEKRLRREAKMMANLKHNNIASIHSAFEHDQYFLYVWSYLENA